MGDFYDPIVWDGTNACLEKIIAAEKAQDIAHSNEEAEGNPRFSGMLHELDTTPHEFAALPFAIQVEVALGYENPWGTTNEGGQSENEYLASLRRIIRNYGKE